MSTLPYPGLPDTQLHAAAAPAPPQEGKPLVDGETPRLANGASGPANPGANGAFDAGRSTAGADPDAAQGSPSPVVPPMPDVPPTAPLRLSRPDYPLGPLGAENLLRTAHQTEATLYEAWLGQAAALVRDALLTDIANGHLPAPAEDPPAIETALLARVLEVMRDSPYVGLSAGLGHCRLLAFASSGPGYAIRRHAWQTPIGPFAEVDLSGPAADASMMEGEGVRAADTILLRVGKPVSAARLGFEIGIRWDEYALQVLRDDILLGVASLNGARSQLLIDRTVSGGPYMLPFRVRLPISPAVPEVTEAPERPATARGRRKRRS